MWLILTILHVLVAGQPPARAIAVTFDDLPTASVLGDDFERAEQTTRTLVAAIRRARVPVTGFVNERKLQPEGLVEPRRVALLEAWINAGFDLGNHTFSHMDLHAATPAAFEQDVIRGEPITRKLMAGRMDRLRYFRHPMLHTGRSREVRDRVLAFLQKHGYTVAPVTIDNYDFIFAAAYDRATAAADRALAEKIVAAYLDYMEAVVAYYEGQSVAILGREIPQTLLLHANALNAATFERLIERLSKRAYRFVTLDSALQDPAYSLPDEYFGPGGITWLHRWALTQGKRGEIFAGEPRVPDWVYAASRL